MWGPLAMATETEKSDFKKRLEKKNNFHFIQHWKEGSRPFDWYANWEHLLACIYEIQIGDSFDVLELDITSDFKADLTDSKPPGLKQGKSAEEREKYVDLISEKPIFEREEETEKEVKEREQRINVFNKRFRIPDRGRKRFIRGKCSLEDDRGLCLLKDGEAPPTGLSRSGKGTISIRAVEGYHLGCIGFVDEDDLKWDRAGESQSGDLWFEFWVPEETFDGIAERVREIGPNAVCIAEIRALVFQGEVDRNLAEPYHRQTFFLEKQKYSTLGHAILESVQVATPKPIGSEPIQGYRNHAIDLDLEEVDELSEPHDQPRVMEQASVSDLQAKQLGELISRLQKPMRLLPVTLALWAVFFGLLLNALAR